MILLLYGRPELSQTLIPCTIYSCGIIMRKIEWVFFLVACAAGLAYQVYILYEEITAASVPIISYEFGKVDIPPAVTICIKWPYFVDRKRGLEYYEERLKRYSASRKPKNDFERRQQQMYQLCLNRVKAGSRRNLPFNSTFKGNPLIMICVLGHHDSTIRFAK